MSEVPLYSTEWMDEVSDHTSKLRMSARREGRGPNTPEGYMGCAPPLGPSAVLQGYLAHEKTPTPLAQS